MKAHERCDVRYDFSDNRDSKYVSTSLTPHSREQEMTDCTLHSELSLAPWISSQPFPSDLTSRACRILVIGVSAADGSGEGRTAGAHHGHVPSLETAQHSILSLTAFRSGSVEKHGTCSKNCVTW
jgi:hypothetical protein